MASATSSFTALTFPLTTLFCLIISSLSSKFILRILSPSSIHILLAVLAPMPCTDAISLLSSLAIAFIRVEKPKVDIILSAPFGPTPFTVRSLKNISLSSLVKKPYRLNSSSFTFIYVNTLMSLSISGKFTKLERGKYMPKPTPEVNHFLISIL